MAIKKKRNTTKNKFVKKLKTACRNIKIEFLRTWKKDPISILVPGISIILLILMSLKLGFIFSFIFLGIINGIYFYLNREKKKDEKKGVMKKNVKKKQKK